MEISFFKKSGKLIQAIGIIVGIISALMALIGLYHGYDYNPSTTPIGLAGLMLSLIVWGIGMIVSMLAMWVGSLPDNNP